MGWAKVFATLREHRPIFAHDPSPDGQGITSRALWALWTLFLPVDRTLPAAGN
jgi:hypothetical protein